MPMILFKCYYNRNSIIIILHNYIIAIDYIHNVCFKNN